MKISAWTFAAPILAIALIFTQAGCTGRDGNGADDRGKDGIREQDEARGEEKEGRFKHFADGRLPDGGEDAVIRLKRIDGAKYVPLRPLAETLEFHTDWDEAKAALNIGGNDVLFEFRVGSSEATAAGETVKLQHPVVSVDGETYIPEEAVDEIFGQVMSHFWTDDTLHIRPNPDPGLSGGEDLPDFSEDPEDPARDTPAFSPMNVGALKDIDTDRLIDTAKRYIGVRYRFGAGPYPETKVFDCSSYTQYVYGKHGVWLPRLSINQSRRGIVVSRSNLRRGDLLFFYWPGRYRSNDIVGHVGIYMGDGKMIHASPVPKDGVQISDLNEARWKKTFLKARRVVN